MRRLGRDRGSPRARSSPAWRRSQPGPAPLIVVYGPEAPTREGDPDHVERLFLSVPADLADRLYLRVFDPEPFGAARHPLRPQRRRHHHALPPLGRRGRLQRRARCRRRSPKAPRRRPRPGRTPASPAAASSPSARFDAASPTDDAWVTLAPFAAADGELVDGRAWFRLDVIGEAGDTGNAFTVEASLSPDRSDPAPDARLFAYQPTIRWREGGDPTEVRFDAPEGAPLTPAELRRRRGRDLSSSPPSPRQRLPASGQDEWRLAPFTAPGGTAAITLRGGAETPNDVTLASSAPTAARSPSRCRRARSRRPPRPVAVGAARPLANCTSVAFDASASTGAGPLAFRWRFGDGAESDAAGHRPRLRRARPLRGRARRPRRRRPRSPAAPASRVPVHVRPAPVADAGEPVTAAPGEPVAFDGSGSTPSDSPLTRFHWTFADGAEADGAAATHAYERPGLYRAVLRVEDDEPATPATSARHPRGHRELPAGRRGGRGAVRRHRRDGDARRRRQLRRRRRRSSPTAGTWATAPGSTARPSPTPTPSPGIYTATLTVTDNSGVANATATDTVTITVNAPPVPVGHRPRPPDRGGRDRRDSTAAAPATPTAPSSPGPGTSATARPARGRRCSTPGPPPGSIRSPSPSPTTAPPPPPITDHHASTSPSAPRPSPTPAPTSRSPSARSPSTAAARPTPTAASPAGTGTSATAPPPPAAPSATPTPAPAPTRSRSSSATTAARRSTPPATPRTVRVNAAPIADAGPDLVAAPGEEVMLDGSGSVDPDGAVADWTWRLPRRLRGRRASASPTPSPTSGLQRVQLTVRDDDRPRRRPSTSTRSRSRSTPRRSPPPAPTSRSRRAQPVRLDGSASFDPDGAIAAWRWDFDDLDDPGRRRRPPSAPSTPPASTPPSSPSPTRSGAANATATAEVTHPRQPRRRSPRPGRRSSPTTSTSPSTAPPPATPTATT